MSKLLDNQLITSYVPKLIELRHGYLINGQYYLGEEMQAVPFCTAYDSKLSTTSYHKMHLNQVIDIYNHSCNPYSNVNHIVVDKFDSEICYIFIENNTETTIDMYKIKESKGRCTIEGYSTMVLSAYNTFLDAFQEDENTIVCLFDYKSATTGTLYRRMFDTKTFAHRGDATVHNGECTTYTKIDDKVYIGDSVRAFNLIAFRNDGTFKIKDIPKPSAAAVYYGTFKLMNVDKTETEEVITYKCHGHASTASNQFDKIQCVTFELRKDDLSCEARVEDVTLEMPDETTIFHRHSYFNYSYYINGESKKFWINIFSSTTVGDLMCVIYEVVDSLNFKFIKQRALATSVVKSILLQDDCRRIVAPSTTSDIFTRITFLDFNESKEDYVVSKSIDDAMIAFGFNKNNEFYVMYQDTSVSKFIDTSVASFDAVFAESFYKYQGEDIATTLKCNVFNLDGTRLSKTVTLDLEGAAIFTDNKTKSIEFTSSASQDTIVNVTITGPGAINIYPKIQA